jgi:hypothetical protein
MNNSGHKIGDFVGLLSPTGIILKKGFVVEEGEDHFCVQWMSYNKRFFMEVGVKEDKYFRDLNRTYLLTKTSYHRTNETTDNILILSKAS